MEGIEGMEGTQDTEDSKDAIEDSEGEVRHCTQGALCSQQLTTTSLSAHLCRHMQHPAQAQHPYPQPGPQHQQPGHR